MFSPRARSRIACTLLLLLSLASGAARAEDAKPAESAKPPAEDTMPAEPTPEEKALAEKVMHGVTGNVLRISKDRIIVRNLGEGSRDHWVEANHCMAQADPVDPPPCTAYAGCDAGFPVVWCAHDEQGFGGHGWPAWAGPAIWAFFAGQ